MAKNILKFWQQGSHDPFDLLFEVAPILMHSIDGQGRLVRVSRFWMEKLGYTEEEMVGHQSVDFLTEASRAYSNDVVMPEFLEKGFVNDVEYEFVAKSGATVPVSLSSVAQFDADGAFHRSLTIMFDASEQRRLRQEQRHEQRMLAIGKLVGGVAHDFNNIMSIIQGNLDFLNDDPDHPDRKTFIADAMRGARRGAALTQDLLSFGRKAHLDPKETDLNKVLRDFDSLARRLMPARIDMELVCGVGLWPVEIDRHQLETALINIVTNARDAMPQGGKLTIETCNVRIAPEYVELHNEDITPGRYVMLGFTDTGTGIDPGIKDSIFEPYFTTKAMGEGSGLGLSMVIGFVKQSRGAILVYSEPGFGTTFKLYFPACEAAQVAEPPPLEDPGDALTPAPLADVLVVEDDIYVRRVLVTNLRLAGISVAEASNGDMGYELLTTGYRPKVIVTDIVMPGNLQGKELADKATALIPGLKVVYVSGFPNEATINGYGIGSEDVHFMKPVDRSAFVDAVREFV